MKNFRLGEVEGAPGFFDAAGIESPGLTAAVPIARYAISLMKERSDIKEKK